VVVVVFFFLGGGSASHERLRHMTSTQTAIRNVQLKGKILFACTVQSNTSLACSGFLPYATKNEEMEQKILGSTVLS